jgi:hypothetical protein
MGAVISKNKNKEISEVNRIKVDNSPSTDKSFHDESEDEAKVDDFIQMMVNLGNKNDIITSILANLQSRRHFIDYLRQEFQNEKLVIRCWKVKTSLIL